MRPLRPPRAGNQHATPDKAQPQPAPFPALDDLPPRAGVKLVRPRRCAATRGCGRSSLTLAARREDPGTCEEDPEEQSAQPGRQDIATGPDPYARLTVVALMGAADRVHPLDGRGGAWRCVRNDGQDEEDVCPRLGGQVGAAPGWLHSVATLTMRHRIASGQVYLQHLGVTTRLTG